MFKVQKENLRSYYTTDGNQICLYTEYDKGTYYFNITEEGFKFDAWSEYFDYGKWIDVFEKSGVDLPVVYFTELLAEALGVK